MTEEELEQLVRLMAKVVEHAKELPSPALRDLADAMDLVAIELDLIRDQRGDAHD